MIFCIAIPLNDPYFLPWLSRYRGFFMLFLTFPLVQNRGIRSRPNRPQFPSLSVKERKAYHKPSFVGVGIVGMFAIFRFSYLFHNVSPIPVFFPISPRYPLTLWVLQEQRKSRFWLKDPCLLPSFSRLSCREHKSYNR